jgi:hypothetical protein
MEAYRSNWTGRQALPQQAEQQLYHQLLVMAHGDCALVERLLRYEAKQTPAAARSELIHAAIERWVSDLNR